jgi:hypothetical protein
MHANKTSQMSSFEEKHYHHLSRQLNGSTVSFSRLTAITKQILVFSASKPPPRKKKNSNATNPSWANAVKPSHVAQKSSCLGRINTKEKKRKVNPRCFGLFWMSQFLLRKVAARCPIFRTWKREQGAKS